MAGRALLLAGGSLIACAHFPHGLAFPVAPATFFSLECALPFLSGVGNHKFVSFLGLTHLAALLGDSSLNVCPYITSQHTLVLRKCP